MKIDSINSPLGVGTVTGLPAASPAKAGGLNFAEIMKNAITEVDQLQKDANEKVEGLIRGGEGVNSHQALIALEKADVAFQLMSAVRTKIVRAYEEVMRTQV